MCIYIPYAANITRLVVEKFEKRLFRKIKVTVTESEPSAWVVFRLADCSAA